MSDLIEDDKLVELSYRVTDAKSGQVLSAVEFPIAYVHGHNDILAPQVLEQLEGKTVGFISNGKEGTKGFFSHLERMLREDLGVAEVVLRQKSNYSAPAETAIIEESRNWDATVTGLGD